MFKLVFYHSFSCGLFAGVQLIYRVEESIKKGKYAVQYDTKWICIDRKMNKAVTSKEKLLQTAREIVFEEGVEKLNIRYLAQKCKIAVGSVYNYFPSKSELVAAVMEEFWKTIFHDDLCTVPEKMPFPEFFKMVYDRIHKHLENFRSVFLSEIRASDPEGISKGKLIEQKYFIHIQRGFLTVLRNDSNISEDLWTEAFTQEKFISFLFQNMLTMLVNDEREISFFIEVIYRLLQYPCEGISGIHENHFI